MVGYDSVAVVALHGITPAVYSYMKMILSLYQLMYYLWLGILAAAATGAVAGTVAYKFSLLSRLMVVAMTYVLNKVGSVDSGGNVSIEEEARSDGQGYRSCVVAREVAVKQALLDAMAIAPGIHAAGACIDSMSVSVPSWKMPLTVKIFGMRLCLFCKSHRDRDSPTSIDNEETVVLEERRLAMALVDELLWGMHASDKNRKKSYFPVFLEKYIGRWKSSVMYGVVQFVIQCIQIEFSNTELYYMQQGEPGPRPSQCKYTGRDAVYIKVRNISLEPVHGVLECDDDVIMSSWRHLFKAVSARDSGESLHYTTVSSVAFRISGLSIDLLTYPGTWSTPQLGRNGKTGQFSFPKYSKMGSSPEKQKVEDFKQTIAYRFINWSNMTYGGCKMSLSEEEVHRIVNQWELAVTLRVIPPGLCPVKYEEHDDDNNLGQENRQHDSKDISCDIDMNMVDEQGPSDLDIEHTSSRMPSSSKRFISTNMSSFTVSVDVNIKALLLNLDIASLGILERMHGRISLIQRFYLHWSRRPNVPVFSNEITWWRHAGNAVNSEVKHIVRQYVALSCIEERRSRRLQYQPLYVSKFSRNPMFRDPNRRWYQRNTVIADEFGLKNLEKIEETLTLEEIAHFRYMAAAKYNQVLTGSADLKVFIASKLDYIISQHHLRKPFSRDMLLHLDCIEPPKSSYTITASVQCPKISVVLDSRKYASDIQNGVPYFVCSLKRISGSWKLGGETTIGINSLEIGPTMTPTSPVQFTSVASPSLLCHRVCRAADFTRYTVTGHVRAETIYAHDTSFVQMEIIPKRGNGGSTVCAQGCDRLSNRRRIKQWRPAGLHIRVKVAAIGAKVSEFRDREDYTNIFFSLVGMYRRSNSYTKRWNQAGDNFIIGDSKYPMLVEKAPTMHELVEEACSRSSIPTSSRMTVSPNSFHIECPGIAVQMPYTYKFALKQNVARGISEGVAPPEESNTETKSIPDFLSPGEFSNSEYMITAVIQNIRLSSDKEKFGDFFDEGTIHRTEAMALIDVFSYLSEGERNAITHKLAPSRYMYDEETREFKQVASGVQGYRQKLTELELTSMAKVWAYPEDMPIISKGADQRTPLFDFSPDAPPRSTKSSIFSSENDFAKTRASPATSLLSKCRYPTPIIPFIKSYGLMASMANRISGMPQVPGESCTSLGLYVRGIQMWLSPVQLAHLKCIADAFLSKIREAGDALGSDDVERKRSDSKAVHSLEVSSSLQVVQVKLHVQQISLIWMIGTWASHGKKGRRHLKTWGITVRKDDPAYLWGQWLAPLYSVSVSGLKVSLRNGGPHPLAFKGGVRGVIARDLQLSELARHAYVLRPLPARTKRIFKKLSEVRREALGVKEPSVWTMAWKRAIMMTMMRKAVDIDTKSPIKQLPSFDDLDLDTAGSQFSFDYKVEPFSGSTYSSLLIEVGQMLCYIRIKQNASVAAFLSQVTTLNEDGRVDKNKEEVKAIGYQSGLRVNVNMVGLDFTGRFKSEDLFSLRLQQGYLVIDRKPVSIFSNPDDVRMHMSAKIDNLTLCDLRATAEHQIVLSPSHNAQYCAMQVHFTSKVDGKRYSPHLVVDISNPRIMLLFRFVKDFMDGIEIVTKGISKANVSNGADGAHPMPEKNAEMPMDFILNIGDIDLILPTDQKKRSVLNISIKELVLANPGNALPDAVLDDASLPQLDSIIEESIICSNTFLYADFSRDKSTAETRKSNHENNFGGDDHDDTPASEIQETSPSASLEAAVDNPKASTRPSNVSLANKKTQRAKKMKGVLLFEEQYDSKPSDNSRAGVLHLPEDSSKAIPDNLDDNILSKPAAAMNLMGKALRDFVGQRNDNSAHVSETFEKPQQTLSESSNDNDIEESVKDDITMPLPSPHLAICIREMKIVSGSLIPIPFAPVGDGSNPEKSKISRGVYHIGSMFATESFYFYDVAGQNEFTEPINLGIVLFERNLHQQLHISLSEFKLVLSQAVYTTIMDFVGGNLADFLHSSDEHNILRFKEIRYNESLRFGPAYHTNVGFRFTLATPELDFLLASHPNEWIEDSDVYHSNKYNKNDVLPFFAINVSNLIMNMVSLDSGDTYMNFCSTKVDMKDLRLGYRLNKISHDIATNEIEQTEPETAQDVQIEPSSPAVSVARRLSNHSLKHRSSIQGHRLNKGSNVHLDGVFADIRSQNYDVPVIDFTNIPSMKAILGDDVACYRLLTTDIASKERDCVGSIPGSNRKIRLETSVAILSDGTMAVEVALSGGILQWPYFYDSSLMKCIAGIFTHVDERQNNACSDNQIDITAWLYINIVMSDTEVFVPIIDANIASRLISELWEPGSLERQNEFERAADMILATLLVHSTDEAGALSLEDRGISFDISLLRCCIGSGGDGELTVKTDLVDVAALIRDPNARIHTVIQPLSASLNLKMQQPEASERHEFNRFNNAAIVIQRHWRRYYLMHKSKEILQHINTSDEEVEVDSNIGGQWKLVEKLAMDVATPRTKALLEDYYSGKGEKGVFSSHVLFKSLSVRSVNLKVGVFTGRLAFSHVAFWKSAIDSFKAFGQNTPNYDDNKNPKDDFRPNGLKVSASFERLAIVLCNDKPETFGAPDVLNICLSDGEGALDMASLLPDRPPNAVGNVSMTLFSSFLNSGSSKWEPMVSPWPVRAEIVDSNGSGFASDRKIHFWLSSERILELTFNPSSLMSIGDALAFYNSLYLPNSISQNYDPDSHAIEEYQSSIKVMSATGMSARAPQKYLIQNQSGLKLYYWTEDFSKSAQKRSPVIGLESDSSDTLKVLPCNKKLTLLNINASATGAERLGSVINLHFEGNWMPIHDVPINVVGKYKYSMISPADNTTVPVLVDVILVGRTKIITVHSGIWVENSIEIPISFRLHVPTTSLVPPGIFKRKQRSTNDEGDLLIGPLKPGEGTYLPLIAPLGGLLFLQPLDYQEATRDVIRLSVDVSDLMNQQGYIVCDSVDLPGVDDQPLHVTMEVVPSRVLSEFQTFKHMEVVAPGTLQRVSMPLEVTISIQPTMIFTNALPYDMNVLLWQVGKQEEKAGTSGGQDDLSFFELMSPRASLNYRSSPDEDKGHYFTFQVPAGGKASVYADVTRDILAHVSLEEVNMRTIKWNICNPAKSSKTDLKDRLEKIPKSFGFRMLDVGLQLPTEAFGIEHYLQRLKEGVSQLRSLNARLRKHARKAVTSRDISRSMTKIRVYARKKSLKKKSKSPLSAPPQTARRATATSARPIPLPSISTPAASPSHIADDHTNNKKKTLRNMFKRSPVKKSIEMSSSSGNGESASNNNPGEESSNPPEYVSRRPPPLNVDLQRQNSDDSNGSCEGDQRQVVAPTLLNVSIHNSLADKDPGSVSRLTFFVPFWMNNRTGVDLFFKDSEASSHPLGIAFPWEYLEVFAPGTSLTQDMDRSFPPSVTNLSGADTEDKSRSKVVLMNQQEDLALGLAHVGNRKYSQPVGIKTVGNKGTIELKGPIQHTSNRGESSNAQSQDDNSEILARDTGAGMGIFPVDESEENFEGIPQNEADGAKAALGAMKVVNDTARIVGVEEGDQDYTESPDNKFKRKKSIQMRSFEFAIDVSAAPRNSVFRNTKLVNLKPKYIIENQTGIPLDVKQFGTSDPIEMPSHLDEGHKSFARTLLHGSRAPVYWDDTDLPKEITIRPHLENESPESWNWSGAFPVPDTEWYFGLRVRHKVSQRRYINIPVNVTVGSSGSIQVTLKSPSSVPPYRIENLCKDVQLFFVQVPLVFRAEGNQYVDYLNPRETMPYAWDEPTLLPKLRVQAKITGRQESRVADYSLDVLGDAMTLLLPTQEEKEEKSAKKLYRSLSNEMPEELKQKLVSLLAAEFSKKVHATVYADGPTRVLRFSDDKNVSSTEHKHVVLDLAFRLKQIENQLRDVNSQFARLSGAQGHQYFAALDLYGRFHDAADGRIDQENSQYMPYKLSRKLPVPESTRKIVKQASKQIFAHSRKASDASFELKVEDADIIKDDQTPQRQTRIGFEAETPASTSYSIGTIHTASETGISTERYESERLGGSSRTRNDTRDWGHLESGDSASRRSARRQATFHTSTNTLNINKRQELLKNIIVGDANLLVGGDLNITVVQAQNLFGSQRATHAFARVRIRDAIRPPEGDERAKQTSVIWQSVDPIWDELVIFRDVCVASELVVELWDLGGTRSSKQLKELSLNSLEVIKTCRFLGRAEIPLTETLDVPAMTPLWYPLMRRSANDEISGKVQLRFHWDVSTRGLMSIKMSAMESVLAQRREIIAALQPIQSLEAISWRQPNPDTFASTEEDLNRNAPQLMPTMGLEMFRIRGEDNFSTIAFNPSQSSIAVLNRHAQDHRQRHLVVTILEARGLNPRSGVVVALSDNELPNPVVTIHLPGYPQYSTSVARHTLNPRWPANQRHIFRGVDPTKAELTIVISDQRNGLRRRAIPLGRGIVHASNVKGDRPTYIWVPAYSVSKKISGLDSMNERNVPDLQIFLRLQWQKKVDRGGVTKLDMDLAGAGMMVVGGLQDELFNFTVEKLKFDSVTNAHERSITGSIESIQVDNQTLNAGEPVVLAPDIGLRPTAAERPLMQFVLTQSFGASFSASTLDKDMVRVEGCSKIGKIASSGTSQSETANIRSFKKFSLSIDPLHLQTDEVFMESLLSFISSLPLSDIWQDEVWQDQQYRLLTAQFGPREVEALAINASMSKSKNEINANMGESTNKNDMALYWILEKEKQDMSALQGQSHLSSWFFIESAEISVVKVNVSISISSRLLNASQTFDVTDSGQFSRALGASGYQLVNVSNVEISFGKWMLGNDPSFRGKRTSNGFLSQRALINNLTRHYTRESLKEAHKVLGGAGPAIASVPLAVLWASGSAVVLLHEVSMGRAGPLGIAQQFVYVPIMTISMLLSGFSRMFAAGMVLIPPARIHGDDETVRRLVKRPNNAIDALSYIPREFILGFASAGQGLLYDPIAGWHSGNLPGLFMGFLKGVVGVPVRPLIGIFEATSNMTGAIAMTSLGREGIVGKTLKRVRAPGAFMEEAMDGLDHENLDEMPSVTLVAAWQRVLPEFFPDMHDEEVKQVMNIRPTRVLLITTHFIAYLKARHMVEHSVYRPKWVVPSFEIQNVQGDPESRKISIIHVRKYDLKIFGVWPVQMRKALRCENRSVFDRTVLRLTKVQQAAQAGKSLDEGGLKYSVPTLNDLTVLSSPYKPPTAKVEEM